MWLADTFFATVAAIHVGRHAKGLMSAETPAAIRRVADVLCLPLPSCAVLYNTERARVATTCLIFAYAAASWSTPELARVLPYAIFMVLLLIFSVGLDGDARCKAALALAPALGIASLFLSVMLHLHIACMGGLHSSPSVPGMSGSEYIWSPMVLATSTLYAILLGLSFLACLAYIFLRSKFFERASAGGGAGALLLWMCLVWHRLGSCYSDDALWLTEDRELCMQACSPDTLVDFQGEIGLGVAAWYVLSMALACGAAWYGSHIHYAGLVLCLRAPADNMAATLHAVSWHLRAGPANDLARLVWSYQNSRGSIHMARDNLASWISEDPSADSRKVCLADRRENCATQAVRVPSCDPLLRRVARCVCKPSWWVFTSADLHLVSSNCIAQRFNALALNVWQPKTRLYVDNNVLTLVFPRARLGSWQNACYIELARSPETEQDRNIWVLGNFLANRSPHRPLWRDQREASMYSLRVDVDDDCLVRNTLCDITCAIDVGIHFPLDNKMRARLVVLSMAPSIQS